MPQTNLLTHYHPMAPLKNSPVLLVPIIGNTPYFRLLGPILVTAHIPIIYKCFWIYPQNASGNENLHHLLCTSRVPHQSPCLCAGTPGLCPMAGWVPLEFKVEHLAQLLLLEKSAPRCYNGQDVFTLPICARSGSTEQGSGARHIPRSQPVACTWVL